MKKKIKIYDRLIGEGEPSFIIAEAGINHDGDMNYQYKGWLEKLLCH